MIQKCTYSHLGLRVLCHPDNPLHHPHFNESGLNCYLCTPSLDQKFIIRRYVDELLRIKVVKYEDMVHLVRDPNLKTSETANATCSITHLLFLRFRSRHSVRMKVLYLLLSIYSVRKQLTEFECEVCFSNVLLRLRFQNIRRAPLREVIVKDPVT
jgi:hypothetical protein